MSQVDIIAGPTTPGPAFGLGEKTDDPVSMYLEDVYTLAVNLAGLPACPCPRASSAACPWACNLSGATSTNPACSTWPTASSRHTDWHLQRPDSAAGGGH